MAEKNIDARQEAAERMQTEKALKKFRSKIAETLLEYCHLKNQEKTGKRLAKDKAKETKRALLQYISAPLSDEILEFDRKFSGVIFEALGALTNDEESMIPKDHLSEVHDAAIDELEIVLSGQFMSAEYAEALSGAQGDKFLLEYSAFVLRAYAFTRKEFDNIEPGEFFKRRFVFELACLYSNGFQDKKGMEAVPKSFLAMLNNKEREGIKRHIENAEKMSGKFNKNVDKLERESEKAIEESGADPRFIRRIKDVNTQGEKEKGILLRAINAANDAAKAEFLKQFPDPRVIIDKILLLKSGKMPVVG